MSINYEEVARQLGILKQRVDQRTYLHDDSAPRHLEDIFQEVLREKRNIKSTPRVMPTGILTTDYTPEATRVLTRREELITLHRRKAARTALKSIQEFNATHGPAERKVLEHHLDSIRLVAFVDTEGRQQFYAGPVNETGINNNWMNLPHDAQKTFSTALQSFVNLVSTNTGAFVPPSCNYPLDAFQYTTLDKLLDENKYRTDHRRENSIRSSGISIRKPEGPSGQVIYMLYNEKGKFALDVKYIIFGPSIKIPGGTLTDKLDIVIGLDSTGRPKTLYHWEKQLPVAYLLENNLFDGLEPKGILEVLALAKIKQGETGNEIKTDRSNGRQFLIDSYNDGTSQRYDVHNSDHLFNQAYMVEPWLLGGEPFAEVLRHTRRNAIELEKIYNKIIKLESRK